MSTLSEFNSGRLQIALMRRFAVCVAFMLLLVGCASKVAKNDFNIALKKEIIHKDSGVVFRVPGNWKVVTQDKKFGTYVASRNGQGLEGCRVGDLQLAGKLPDYQSNIADVDEYFLKHGIARIEEKGKLKFINSNIEKLSGIIMGGTHNNEPGSGVSIVGFVKNIDQHTNQHMAIYIAYSQDITNRVGVECSMVGKDKNGEFLKLFKQIAQSVNYKNEYYK